jgi:hypothetical protein
MPIMRDIAVGVAGSDGASLMAESPLTEALAMCVLQGLSFRCKHELTVQTEALDNAM